MSKLTQEHANTFARFLTSQAGSTGRANLAELRRAAANPGHDFRDLRILGGVLADDTRIFDAQRLTAGLFALYAPRFWTPASTLRLPGFSQEAKRRSFGASLRQLRNQLKAGQDSLDLRFTALLDTPREDLTVPLRGLLQRLATAERPIPVDFARLLQHLVFWEYDQPGGRSVRRDWARDYWQPSAADDDAIDDAATALTSDLPVLTTPNA